MTKEEYVLSVINIIMHTDPDITISEATDDAIASWEKLKGPNINIEPVYHPGGVYYPSSDYTYVTS